MVVEHLGDQFSCCPTVLLSVHYKLPVL